MKPSKMRYRDAVKSARDFVYGVIDKMPEHFDERQARVFAKYVAKTEYQKKYFDELDDEMWIAYTGYTRREYEKFSQQAEV